MSHHNYPTGRKFLQHGFTLVELMVVIALVGVLATTFYAFVNNSLSEYLNLQKDASDFSDLSYQSQRLAQVMRGITDIVSENADSLTATAYFEPNDAAVSQVRYYKNANGTQLLAEVIPYDVNPPNGTLQTAQTRTVVVIPNFYQAPGVNTFTYLDDGGNTLPLPIADEHSIKGIQVTVAAKGAHNSDQTMSVQVSLRNRKYNL